MAAVVAGPASGSAGEFPEPVAKFGRVGRDEQAVDVVGVLVDEAAGVVLPLAELVELGHEHCSRAGDGDLHPAWFIRVQRADRHGCVVGAWSTIAASRPGVRRVA
jgi:hypothetical protein